MKILGGYKFTHISAGNSIQVELFIKMEVIFALRIWHDPITMYCVSESRIPKFSGKIKVDEARFILNEVVACESTFKGCI